MLNSLRDLLYGVKSPPVGFIAKHASIPWRPREFKVHQDTIASIDAELYEMTLRQREPEECCSQSILSLFVVRLQVSENATGTSECVLECDRSVLSGAKVWR